MLLTVMMALGASTASADFNATTEDLTRILSNSRVRAELGTAGDLWTIHRIQSGDYYGYQIVTADGCKLNTLLVKGDVVTFSKNALRYVETFSRSSEKSSVRSRIS
ncbi:MAG: hypothetical protein HC902_05315 [Calothrix sp. SM1_5_4]|nr:hypothetical protein [Calothrix sp. SM1_5_4]